MLTEYIQKALEKAYCYCKVLEDGTWFAEVPGFKGFGRMLTLWRNVAVSL